MTLLFVCGESEGTGYSLKETQLLVRHKQRHWTLYIYELFKVYLLPFFV